MAGRFVAHGRVQVTVAAHDFVYAHIFVYALFIYAHVSGFAHARFRPAP